LAKLRNLPENKKKIILWAVAVVLGLIMGFFWVKGAANSLSKLNMNKQMQNIEIPQTSIPYIPIPDLPNIKISNNPSPTPDATPPINK